MVPSEESFIESTSLMAGCSNIPILDIFHIQLFIYSITSCGVGSQFFIVRLKVAGFVLIIKIIVWRTFQPHYVAESFVSFVENWRE